VTTDVPSPATATKETATDLTVTSTGQQLTTANSTCPATRNKDTASALASCLVCATVTRRAPTERIVTATARTETTANSTEVSTEVACLADSSPCQGLLYAHAATRATTDVLSPSKVTQAETDRILTSSMQTEMNANSTCTASRRTDGVTSLVSRLVGCSPCPRWSETRPDALVTTCPLLPPMMLARQVQTNPTANTKKQMTANSTSWAYKLTTAVVALVAFLEACPAVSLAARPVTCPVNCPVASLAACLAACLEASLVAHAVTCAAACSSCPGWLQCQLSAWH